MAKEYWYCVIGPVEDRTMWPPGADGPLRHAVEKAFKDLTGFDSGECYSAWGISEPAKERMLLAAHSAEDVTKISLEQAVDDAANFLERGGTKLHRLKVAKHEGNIWRVKFDIGLFWRHIVELLVDDITGKVLQCQEV